LGVRVLQQQGDIGLGVLLPELLGLPGHEYESDRVVEQVMTARMVLQTDLGQPTGSKLKPLLGLGRGLTPSGDDLLVGFLLALNRWKSVLDSPFDLKELNGQMIQLAVKATTHLSANLIECAATGAADERLLDGLDYIVSGMGNPDEIADNLSEMGSSSGVDSLVGMVLAFEVCGML
jgi:hypothetical protein